ncbi:MAG: chromosome segregation protein SMC [Armatimonadetes bacterium]|nr:chromosome segregation protein SMC [Armatimonadota bacterium]
MRLKRVRIFGFKTFAEKTEFSLDGGIVAVVGPNGCGKSNLVDAILWGLGEGSIKHLRASSSQDVIFSGSQNRKPVGYAEVSLCFDNEDGTLPIEASEVWITRRLTRGGDSDYSINRQSCRLKDILELLADSGLGRAGYAIVGQKEIDQALAASAEDRRAWIDEAAGVQRYRARKVESLRRLAAARDSLSRVDDIINELESQREPLREEAEVAVRFKQLDAALREVEVGLLIRDLCGAVHELQTLEEKIAQSGQLVERERVNSARLEQETEESNERIRALDSQVERTRTLHQDQMTLQERAEANVKITEEKISSLIAQEKNLKEDEKTVSNRLGEAAKDAESAIAEVSAEIEALEKIQLESAGASSESKELSDRLKQAEKDLQEAREKKGLRMKWEAEREAQEGRARLLNREISGIEKALPQLGKDIEAARKDFEVANAAMQEHDAALGRLQTTVDQIKKDEDRESAKMRDSLAERASLDGRRRGIEATLDAHEGLSQGSRAVLEARDRGLIRGEFESVADAIDVDKEYSLAIETALGASANDLIVDTDQDAKHAVNWLKENRAGRCTFQPISLMRRNDPSPELRRVLNERGVINRASDLVRCERRVEPVIESLLGRIVIVETIDDALKLAKTSGWSRMVTLEGEVVHSSGAVTGGQTQRQSYGIVQRRADLAEIEREIAEIDKLLAGADQRKQKRAKEIAECEALMADHREQRQVAKEPADEAEHLLKALEDELRDAERQLHKAKHEIEQIEKGAQAGIDDVDITAFERVRDECLKAVASKSADVEQAEVRLREAQERVRQAQIRQYASEKRLESAKEAEHHRERRLENLGPERDRLRKHVEELRAEAETHAKEKQTLMVSLTALTKERRELGEHVMKIQEELKEARANVMALSESNHQNELSRARAETKRATLAERLMDAYGLSETDALAQENMHEVPADAQTVVGRLRREIKAMGDVNTGAIEAFERLTERLESLSLQRDDIMKGIEQVEASIAELDKLTRDKFVSTFEAVGAEFSVMFTLLFGGGTASIELTDPAKVLESGVEIVVQLPGKKRQPLQLLSGGERSLCASAFLFALLKVKPAPLVVLDEVDAPLDGRNVERFAQTLEQFSELIQFVVITHNPTTIEIAPNLFGVTMQEAGVSTLIPMKLPESKAVIVHEADAPVA